MGSPRSRTHSTIDGPASEFSVNANGKEYQARTGATRTADESATFDLTKIVPAPTGDNCSGGAVGTISVKLVEISAGGVVGAGRAQATVTMTE